MMISAIVAMSRNGVIGRSGGLPWRLSADLKRFKSLTVGHSIIMGRKTFESIGKPLSDRRNIVVTRNKDFGTEGVEVTHSIDEGLKLCKGEDEVFVIGGEEIYKQAMPLVRKLYMTFVEAEVRGDVHFPKIDDKQWRLVDSELHNHDEKNEFDYSFLIYERRGQKQDKRFAKTEFYEKAIDEADTEGVCMLCPDTMRWHTKPILNRIGDWLITENFRPYENAKHHFLIIGSMHKEEFWELTAADFESVAALVNWAIHEFHVPGGGLVIRFGDSSHTGATITHLHFHLIVPIVENDVAKPVYFPIG